MLGNTILDLGNRFGSKVGCWVQIRSGQVGRFFTRSNFNFQQQVPDTEVPIEKVPLQFKRYLGTGVHSFTSNSSFCVNSEEGGGEEEEEDQVPI